MGLQHVPPLSQVCSVETMPLHACGAPSGMQLKPAASHWLGPPLEEPPPLEDAPPLLAPPLDDAPPLEELLPPDELLLPLLPEDDEGPPSLLPRSMVSSLQPTKTPVPRMTQTALEKRMKVRMQSSFAP